MMTEVSNEISPYEWLAQEFERLAVLRKMWTALEVAAMIRRHDLERDRPAALAARPSPTGEKVEAVAWCQAETLARLQAGKAVLADLSAFGGNVYCEPLYSAETVSALEAERDEARADRDFLRDNRNKWQDATTRERNRAAIAESSLAAANARVERLETGITKALKLHWQDEATDVRDEMVTVLATAMRDDAALTGGKK